MSFPLLNIFIIKIVLNKVEWYFINVYWYAIILKNIENEHEIYTSLAD